MDPALSQALATLLTAIAMWITASVASRRRDDHRHDDDDEDEDAPRDRP